MKRLVLLALPVVVIALPACGLPTGPTVTYCASDPALASATVSEDPAASPVWESTPWTGVPWIEFGPRQTIQLEHTLGYMPRVVLTYIAFTADADDPALAAGDLARVVDPATLPPACAGGMTVAVMNDTNASYFMRVVAF